MGPLALTTRDEKSADRKAVRGVNVAACGGEAETDLVERLYDDGDTLFGLVAEVAGRVVGHMLFSRLPIDVGDSRIAAAALAPLAVLPEWQGRGIGSALGRHELDRCRERGIAAVVVLGGSGFARRPRRGCRLPGRGRT